MDVIGRALFGRFFHKCLNMVTHTHSLKRKTTLRLLSEHTGNQFKGQKNDTWFDIIASPKGQRRS